MRYVAVGLLVLLWFIFVATGLLLLLAAGYSAYTRFVPETLTVFAVSCFCFLCAGGVNSLAAEVYYRGLS
jgi:hypothetical protein